MDGNSARPFLLDSDTGEGRTTAHLEALADIYRTAPIGFAVIDREMRYVWINEWLARANGLSVEAHLGRTVREIIPALADELEALMGRVIGTGEPCRDVEVSGDTAAHPGVVRTWLEHWNPVRDRHGQVTGVSVVVEDITERKAAETSLIHREARLTLAVKSGLAGTFDWDAATNVNVWSDELLALYGLGRDEFGGRYEDWIACLVPEDRELGAQAMQRSLQTGDFNVEFRIGRRDTGAIRWMHARGQVFFDATGAPARMVGINVDITDRKVAEEALRANEALLSATLAGMEAAVTVSEVLDAGRDFRYVLANRATLDWCGFALADLIGRRPQDVLSPADAEALCTRYRRAVVEERGFSYEERIVFPSGPIWALTHVQPLRGPGGTIDRVVATSIDISERKRIEEALQESEARFRSLANGLPLIVWVHDADGALVFVNDTQCRFFDTTREEMQGGRWQGLLHPDDADAYVAEFLRCVRERRLFNAETRVKDGAGRWRYIESWGNPRFSDSGEYLGFVGASADVTDRREVEQALRQADRQKDEFLALLSHELRNPLAPLRTGLRIIERTEPLTERGRGTLAMVERQTRQMQRLVDDLLEVSRITRGKIELQPEIVNVATMINDAADTLAHECEVRSHRLLVLVPPEPMRIHADPVRLAQVLENLLHNACKYTPDGGEIRVEARGTLDDVEIRVVDNGMGIDPDEQASLFTLFHQIDTTLDRARGGLGIGLALVRRLVEMHGGSVSASSEGRGKGSTFTVRLPQGRLRLD